MSIVFGRKATTIDFSEATRRRLTSRPTSSRIRFERDCLRTFAHIAYLGSNRYTIEELIDAIALLSVPLG